MLKIGVLASGRGSNFKSVLASVRKGLIRAEICVLISDRPGSGALETASSEGIDAVCLDRKKFSSRSHYEKEIVTCLKSREAELVVLAGYMRIAGKALLSAYPMRIVNIHPSLLPSFPGLNAQKQALEHGVRVSGCTVHFVDRGMDTGPIILQKAVPVLGDDSEESLAERILEEEHRILPEAIKLIADGKVSVQGRIVKIREE